MLSSKTFLSPSYRKISEIDTKKNTEEEEEEEEEEEKEGKPTIRRSSYNIKRVNFREKNTPFFRKTLKCTFNSCSVFAVATIWRENNN